MPTTLKLFSSPGSCSQASHLALEEAGARYEIVKVDLAGGEQTKPAYLAINPKGRVPALVTDRGIITETPAILLYVAQTHPQARLAPLDDPFALAQVQSFNNYLSSTVHVAHSHGRRASRWADDPAAQAAMQAKVSRNMTDCFALIEAQFGEGPWVMGDAYSICDVYLFTVTGWLEGDGVDYRRFPKVAAHVERMKARPAVQRVLGA